MTTFPESEPFQVQRCWACNGTVIGRRQSDLGTGQPIIRLVCQSCFRRWDEADTPPPAIAA